MWTSELCIFPYGGTVSYDELKPVRRRWGQLILGIGIFRGSITARCVFHVPTPKGVYVALRITSLKPISLHTCVASCDEIGWCESGFIDHSL